MKTNKGKVAININVVDHEFELMVALLSMEGITNDLRDIREILHNHDTHINRLPKSELQEVQELRNQLQVYKLSIPLIIKPYLN